MKSHRHIACVLLLGNLLALASLVGAKSPQEAMVKLERKGGSVKGQIIFTVVDVKNSNGVPLPDSYSFGGSDTNNFQGQALELDVSLSSVSPKATYEWFIQTEKAPGDGSCSNMGAMFSQSSNFGLRSTKGATNSTEEAVEQSLNESSKNTNSTSDAGDRHTVAVSDMQSPEFTGKGYGAVFEMCRLGDLTDKFGPIEPEQSTYKRKVLDPSLQLTGDASIVGRSVVIWDMQAQPVACGTITTDMSGRSSSATALGAQS
ncbi:hypothetical protein H4R35_007543, partial [Dimargaris xerosporica]